MKFKNDNRHTAGQKDYATCERAGSLLQPDTLLAEEFFANTCRTIPLEPVLAVLEDSVRCFQDNVQVEGWQKESAVREEAQEWLFSDAADGLYTFVTGVGF